MQQTNQNVFARSPTLETVYLVEQTIEKNSGEYNRTKLWKNLPRKVMWQTFLVIMDYLEHSNKIITDKDEKIVWIWNPNLIRELEAKGLLNHG